MRGFPNRRHAKGQAMVEYALIGVLIVIAIGVAIAFTDEAVGNIFSNVISNASGEGTPIYPTLNPTQIKDYANSIGTMKPVQYDYKTNTPLAPTCLPPNDDQWAVTLAPPATPGNFSPC